MILARILVPMALLGVVACDTESPTRVVVDNDYPPVLDGGDTATQMTVFKVWWVTSMLPDPVMPASEGQSQRTVPSSDFAYALLAPGWDPSSSTPPARFVAARSVVPLRAARGDTLHVRVADETFVGNCAGGKPLDQDEADFIAQRIFPGELGSNVYDARTCTALSLPTEGGSFQTSDASQAETGVIGEAGPDGSDAGPE